MDYKLKRNVLSLAKKIELLAKSAQPGVARKDLAKEFGIDVSCVCRILKNRESLLTEWLKGGNQDRKRKRDGKDARIEDALFRWFAAAQDHGIPVSGPVLMEKARDLAIALGVEFEPTSGWLSRWKKRNNIGNQCPKADASIQTVENWYLNTLPSLLAGYSPADIFKADEIAVFFREMPDRVVESSDVVTMNRAREYVTVLVCANSSGTEKMRLLVIGRSKKPRCFKGVTMDALPVQYEADFYTRLSANIFQRWVAGIDVCMRRAGRQIILFIDHCTAHSIGDPENVKIVILPPKSPSLFQYVDREVTRSLRQNYRKQIFTKIIGDFDGSDPQSAIDLARSITILDAAHMLNAAWKEVQPETIRQCFAQAGLWKGVGHEAMQELPGPTPQAFVPSGHPLPYELVQVKKEINDGLPKMEICKVVVENPDRFDTGYPVEGDVDEDDEDDDSPEIVPPSTREVWEMMRRIRNYVETREKRDFEWFYSFEKRIESLCDEIPSLDLKTSSGVARECGYLPKTVDDEPEDGIGRIPRSQPFSPGFRVEDRYMRLNKDSVPLRGAALKAADQTQNRNSELQDFPFPKNNALGSSQTVHIAKTVALRNQSPVNQTTHVAGKLGHRNTSSEHLLRHKHFPDSGGTCSANLSRPRRQISYSARLTKPPTQQSHTRISYDKCAAQPLQTKVQHSFPCSVSPENSCRETAPHLKLLPGNVDSCNMSAESKHSLSSCNKSNNCYDGPRMPQGEEVCSKVMDKPFKCLAQPQNPKTLTNVSINQSQLLTHLPSQLQTLSRSPAPGDVSQGCVNPDVSSKGWPQESGAREVGKSTFKEGWRRDQEALDWSMGPKDQATVEPGNWRRDPRNWREMSTEHVVRSEIMVAEESKGNQTAGGAQRGEDVESVSREQGITQRGEGGGRNLESTELKNGEEDGGSQRGEEGETDCYSEEGAMGDEDNEDGSSQQEKGSQRSEEGGIGFEAKDCNKNGSQKSEESGKQSRELDADHTDAGWLGKEEYCEERDKELVHELIREVEEWRSKAPLGEQEVDLVQELKREIEEWSNGIQLGENAECEPETGRSRRRIQGSKKESNLLSLRAKISRLGGRFTVVGNPLILRSPPGPHPGLWDLPRSPPRPLIPLPQEFKLFNETNDHGEPTVVICKKDDEQQIRKSKSQRRKRKKGETSP